MKKILAAGLSISLLFAGSSVEAHAETTVKKTDQSFRYPDLTNKKVIARINNGTFSYKGIKLGMTFKDVKKKLGKPSASAFDKQDNKIYGSYTYTDYKNMLMFQSIEDAGVSHAAHQVKGIYLGKTEGMKYNDIKANLGKYKTSIKSKNMKIRQYGDHMGLILAKHEDTWYVDAFYYGLEETF